MTAGIVEKMHAVPLTNKNSKMQAQEKLPQVLFVAPQFYKGDIGLFPHTPRQVQCLPAGYSYYPITMELPALSEPQRRFAEQIAQSVYCQGAMVSAKELADSKKQAKAASTIQVKKEKPKFIDSLRQSFGLRHEYHLSQEQKKNMFSDAHHLDSESFLERFDTMENPGVLKKEKLRMSLSKSLSLMKSVSIKEQ